ncbi:PilW family protein [Cloacibacillus porcorum]|uniref:PilW family protein n=1 Tax=Cloacibacillus porcorum TaxID=1197717 RepID=UPI0023F21DA7|nr:prepilin-type N-terminal cleavage/methylation domain-containing protein [Cloacibacillus porcorum]MDD7649803.1 prepilin-type N-terminal cleavage/methylation domain-containing protein [Cloacibacillus porcorum]MDY4093128.1 prepilin-type N-terminal cleavage/methylation domain-containing protein [Cloacibacillus porcorum]
MRTQKRRRAFTLVELIIGMVMMVIVMGGIITGLSMGLRLYGRAEANGKVTNGARFTAASFKHKIWPMMSRASIVEILPNLPDVAVSDSEDCYVYLDESEQCVKYRIGNRDEPLAGSEYITSLDFSVPAASEDLAENFILKMRVEAQAPRVKSAHVTLDIDSALINRPAKRGSATKAAAYGGPVLHFNIFDFRELQLRNLSDDNKILQNEETIEKDSVIQLRYNIIVPSDNKDATKTLYYISSESKPSLKKSAGYWEDGKSAFPDYNNEEIRSNYCWPLLITSGDEYYLAGDQYKKASGKEDEFLKIPTSGTFYVYTGKHLYGNDSDFEDDGKLKSKLKDGEKVENVVKRFGSFGYLRAWVVPAYSDSDGGGFVRPKGYEQWSVRVRILQSNPDGQPWFRRFTQHQVDRVSNNIFLDSTDSNFTAVGYINPETGEYRVKMEYHTGNNHIQIGGALLPEDIGDARRYEKKIFNESYTNITNYSIIVDAEAGTTTAGLALLLNGYRNNDATSGYCLYYDPGANGYPIRLQNTTGNVNGYQRYGVQEIDSPIESVINNTTDIGSISGGSGGTFYNNYYNPQYVNAALQNEFFKTKGKESDEQTLQRTKGDFTNECKVMQPRRRYMVTILEYHTGDKENPRLLVRMRLLKNLSEVMAKYPMMSERELRAEDPFLCGPRFYYSEPAWYGSFVGQKPKMVTTGTGNKTTYQYIFKAKRYGADGADIERTVSTNENGYGYYNTGSNFYALQTPDINGANSRYKEGFSYKIKNQTKTFNGGVYKAQSLDPRKELGSYDKKDNNLGNLKPDRYRWIGLAIWGGQLGNRSSVEIYDMTIAPGFDAGELRSITENGAQVFGMDETNGSFPTGLAEYSADRDTSVKWNHELFGISSDGNGNQSHGNAYAGRFKNAQNETQPCVMSLQHVSSDYTSCGCPMCEAYRKYNNK